MVNPLILKGIKKAFTSQITDLAKEYKRLPEKILNSPIEKYQEIKAYASQITDLAKEYKRLPDEVLNSPIEKHKSEVNSTREGQYVDSKTLEEWRKKPENEDKLELGKEHSGKVLRNNLEAVTGENPENSAAHHIVGNDTPEAAKKLEEFGIDRNDPANGIFLPASEESKLKGSIHDGRHSKEYCNEVERRFQNVTSKEECLEVLDSLKEDLYNGDLNVNKDNRFNQ